MYHTFCIFIVCVKNIAFFQMKRVRGGKARTAMTIMLVDSHLTAVTGSWSCR